MSNKHIISDAVSENSPTSFSYHIVFKVFNSPSNPLKIPVKSVVNKNATSNRVAHVARAPSLINTPLGIEIV